MPDDGGQKYRATDTLDLLRNAGAQEIAHATESYVGETDSYDDTSETG